MNDPILNLPQVLILIYYSSKQFSLASRSFVYLILVVGEKVKQHQKPKMTWGNDCTISIVWNNGRFIYHSLSLNPDWLETFSGKILFSIVKSKQKNEARILIKNGLLSDEIYVYLYIPGLILCPHNWRITFSIRK